MSTQQRLTSQQKHDWNRSGYLILSGFFSREEVGAVNRIVDQRLAVPSTFGNATVDPLQGPYAGQRLRAADAPSEVFKVPLKINDLFLDEPEVRNIALSERLTAILSQLLGGPPMICNSLNFIWGSQQAGHVDSWYMPAPPPYRSWRYRIRERFPHRPDIQRRIGEIWNERLAVSSVCLEDVHPDAGPLMYYPGSHKLIAPCRTENGSRFFPPSEAQRCCVPYIQQQIKEKGLEEKTFLGKAGDVFLWHGQLVHGGSTIKDLNRTRKTLVTHYWRAHDLPPHRLVQVHPTGFYEKRTHQNA